MALLHRAQLLGRPGEQCSTEPASFFVASVFLASYQWGRTLSTTCQVSLTERTWLLALARKRLPIQDTQTGNVAKENQPQSHFATSIIRLPQWAAS